MLKVKKLKYKFESTSFEFNFDLNSNDIVGVIGKSGSGKSTLFNELTKQKIYAADQLFATLDTTSRKLFIPPSTSLVISDTVGFIKNLPT